MSGGHRSRPVPGAPRHGCPPGSSRLPQRSPADRSGVLYRFDVNIREASVLGLVGAGGIGAPLIFAMNQYDWNKAGAILLGLILLVWGVDILSSRR